MGNTDVLALVVYRKLVSPPRHWIESRFFSSNQVHRSHPCKERKDGAPNAPNDDVDAEKLKHPQLARLALRPARVRLNSRAFLYNDQLIGSNSF